jgi:acyl-CoA synthetase (AMP-forming)/AMP-acid ligase II
MVRSPYVKPPKRLLSSSLKFLSCSAAIAEVRGDIKHWGPLGAMAIPPFHIFGVIQQLWQPLAGTTTAVYPPTAISPTALPITPSPGNILEHARKTKCRSLITVPALLAAWSTSPAAIAYLKTLDKIVSHVCYINYSFLMCHSYFRAAHCPRESGMLSWMPGFT